MWLSRKNGRKNSEKAILTIGTAFRNWSSLSLITVSSLYVPAGSSNKYILTDEHTSLTSTEGGLEAGTIKVEKLIMRFHSMTVQLDKKQASRMSKLQYM